MQPQPLLVPLSVTCLLVLAGCPANEGPTMPTSDQGHTNEHDLGIMSIPDAADPNAPGMVRYSYVCDGKPEKTVELPHQRFGATYSCNFENDYFLINVKDTRVPIDFRLSIPFASYHGPGTYPVTADKFSGSGFAYCQWPSIRIQDGNCPALAGSSISACCLGSDAQKNSLSCSITVQEHSLSRVTGSFTCQVRADSEGVDSPFMCPFLSHADVMGSFDFGPKDCT